ncbi:biotin--[acetyl-CoA-carboxylase] ligase [Mycolicibacillus parakoreensis]|uniref:biotin--[biotin carboxyl-carrier protein] ligase n=1 Tax=Mycolicibacillus parakoreensis TaxID=1069221 RepID=A0ABY3U018_9MYCO|nr:biotin--[acetyl-CoA-carboxylase] ligase [Mycolicibacillus parakoreensis]MCV7315556.1 biotin--[acetyl-CoA-carboxylase] ligase [Mycolicibacillus parakoreensis]ULN51996.1 biotin--[acetyl-CoA-carboxylase] ligase [Mycolicibacillus parakoreensis]HLR98560.1 biotin--[acetyl-CoA-carboxylase] ligase [Mycolicibacillus parakoreensis]
MTERAAARPALDDTALRSALAGRWRRIDVVEQTGSTNADLLARAAGGEDIGGAVLAAEHQSAGRGRQGRGWSAPPRSQLSLSVGVDAAAVPASAWGWLPLATGVAVTDALAELTDLPVGLKWPNDVLAGPGDAPGKLAGILAEVAAPAKAIVVGVGLNAAMSAQEAPAPQATSLSMLGAPTDRTALAVALLEALAERIGAWRAAGGADRRLVADYTARSVTVGRRVRALLPGEKTVQGIAEAIDEMGRLRVATGAETVAVAAGDVTHLRPV